MTMELEFKKHQYEFTDCTSFLLYSFKRCCSD